MIKKRDYSMDLLKFLASFGVVMIHVDANFRQGEFIKNTFHPLWGRKAKPSAVPPAFRLMARLDD